MSKAGKLASAKRYGPAGGGDGVLGAIEALLEPFVLMGSLFLVGLYFEREVTAPCMVLSMIVFALTFPGISRLRTPVGSLVVQVMLSWTWLAVLLLLGAYATRSLGHFSAEVLRAWLWVAPLTLVLGHLVVRMLAPAILSLQGPPQKVVIVGLN